VGYQAITARTRIDDIQAALARTVAEPVAQPVVEPAAQIVSVPVADVPPPTDFAPTAKRRYPRPFSQVAAMLPSVTVTRPPRAKTAPVVGRARTSPPVHSLAVPPASAPRTVSEVRERLERGEDLSQAPWLSARVVSHLTAEEIAMLPMDLRLRLPDAADWQAPPRIELTPMPGLPCVDLHPVPTPAPVEVTDHVGATEPAATQVVTIAICTAFLLLGACAVYAVL
jgi:hypothetical protein